MVSRRRAGAGCVLYLEHGQEQVLFTALILVAINCEHDCLQQRVDLSHGYQSAEVGNVSWFRLEEKQQVAISLCLLIVGERSLLQFESIFKVAGDFVLL